MVMSYTVNVNIIEKNNPHLSLQAKGIVLHETATPNATDEAEQRYFNNNNVNASAHAFVDYDSITQCIYWDEKAWHAGPTANNKFIGIELCHFDDPVKFQELWNRGVWLCAYLFVTRLKLSTVTKDNLMSHKEVSLKWGETNHMDPDAYFAAHGKTMNDFRKDVQIMIDEMNKPTPAPVPAPSIPQWKYDGAQWLVDNGYTKELHNPNEVIDIGTFGTMMKNMKKQGGV